MKIKITKFFCCLLIIASVAAQPAQAASLGDVSSLLSRLLQQLSILVDERSQLGAVASIPTAGLEVYLTADNSLSNTAGVDPVWQNGSGAYASGIAGSAFSFDGGTAYVRFPHIAAIVGTQNISAMLWAKRDAANTGAQTILSRHATFWITSGETQVTFSLITESGSRVDLSAPFTDDNGWHHYAMTYDGSEIIGYIDGEVVKVGRASGVVNVGSPYDSWALAIGRGSIGGPVFEGNLDEVQLFSRTLVENEIAAYVASFDTTAQVVTAEQNIAPVSTPVLRSAPVAPQVTVAAEGDIYVDAQLTTDCNGTYSVSARSCTATTGGKDAFNTIQEAVDSVTDDSTIWIRAGTYRESVTYNSAAEDVTISGYKNEMPVLSGTKKIEGWLRCTASLCGNNPNASQMYYTKVAESDIPSVASFSLIEDGDLLFTASYPNQTNAYVEDVKLFAPVDASSYGRYDGFTALTLNQPINYWNGTKVRFWSHALNSWVTEMRVGDFTNGNVVFSESLTQPVAKGSLPDGYSFVNSLLPEVLDTAGEYVISETPDSNGYHTVYVWPRNSSNLSNMEYITKDVGLLILYGGHGLTVENMEISGFAGSHTRAGGIVFPYLGINLRDLVFRNLTIHNVRGAYGIGGLVTEGALVENVTVYNTHSGTKGIYFAKSTDVTVRDSDISDTGGTMIYFGEVTDGKIIGNYLHGKAGTHANGITVYQDSENVLIKDNHVYNTGNVHLTLQSGKDMAIINNLFDGNNMSGVIVSDWGGMTGYVKYINNTIVNSNNNNSIQIGKAEGTTLKNNILDGGGKAEFQDNNIWTGLLWNQAARYGWSMHPTDVFEEDLNKIFVNPAEADYRLRSDSIARDTGVDVSVDLPRLLLGENTQKDYVGATVPQGGAYDIGAYEYTGATVVLDTDSDGVPNTDDNCPFVANYSQVDIDGDGIGDLCDTVTTPSVAVDIPVTTPQVPAALIVPDQIVVIEPVNVRERPSITAQVIDEKQTGDTGSVVNTVKEVEADGFLWVPVSFENGSGGWVVKKNVYVKPSTGASSIPNNSGGRSDIVPQRVTSNQTQKRVRLTENLNVRATPGGALIKMMNQGSVATQVSEEVVPQGAYNWIEIQFPDGTEGYVAKEFTTPAVAPASASSQQTELIAQLKVLLSLLVQKLQARLVEEQ